MTVGEGESAIERARGAFARCAWIDAYAAFSLAEREGPLDLEDLERMAWSAGLAGRDDEFLKLLERLHDAHLEQRAPMRAARAAFWLGQRHVWRGEAGRGGAWLARVQRLVEQEGGPCAEEGFLLLPAVNRHLGAGDYEAALAAAKRAAEIGERYGELELIALAGHLQGRALLHLGRIDEGLSRLDETMLAAASGKLLPVVTGILYCGVMGAFNLVYAYDRGREWTATLAAYAESQPQLVAFASTCLVHRAELMQFGGEWAEAIAEADRATQRGTNAPDGAAGSALYQRAEILRMRGAFTEAEAAYRAANQLGCDPQPGLALLRLAQGRSDVAASAVQRALSANSTPLARARFLPACVEILIAAGDCDAASLACAELERIAASHGTEVLSAMAAHARGALRLREGDARGALEPLRRALAGWQRAGAPYLAARLRLTIAAACRALGDEDGAQLEIDAARGVFERLGAAPDLQACDALAGGDAGASSSPPAARGLSGRELQVLRLVAAGKTNRAIARELHLSEKTVDRHVSNILTKLDVPSRAAATAYAYEHRLI